jgi:hypothetical protein
MIDLGLSPAKRAQLIRLLHTPHTIRMSVAIQTLEGSYTIDLSPYFMGGQININSKEQVTRSADLSIFDPFRRIQLDPDDPSKISVGMADLARINYVVTDPETNDSFAIPVFTGPIDDVQRDETTLKITCVGKEALAVGNSYVGKIYRKGAKKTDVIFDILRNIIGEASNKIQIPDLGAKLPADWRLSQGSIPWDAAKSLARSLGYQLFYDGRGVCRMRVPGSKAVHTFDNYWVSSPPQIDWSTEGIINTVVVKGGKPKKAKKNVSYTAVASPNHPLSPNRLGRNGVPRYLYTTIENSGLLSTAECKALAVQTLNRGLLVGFNAKWDALPMPLLEESDMVHINAHGLNATVALEEFAIPLTIGTASYGYTRSVGQRGGQRGISGAEYSSYRKKAAQWAAQIRKADRKKDKKKDDKK